MYELRFSSTEDEVVSVWQRNRWHHLVGRDV